jgi:hypothetical protein
MANYTSFPIVDMSSGLFTAKDAWLAPHDAYQDMQNACLKRSKIQKRKGSKLVAYAADRQFTLAGAATDFEDSGDLVEVGETGHGLVSGQYIVLQGVTGTGASGLNDQRFFITKVDDDNFTLDGVTYSGLGPGATPQDGTVDLINALTDKGKISSVSKANPALVVTSSAHGLSTGNTVQIVEEPDSSIVGMKEILYAESTVTVTSTTEFELDQVNSTNFTAYTSGGTVALVDTDADPITGLFEFKKFDGTSTMMITTTKRLGEFTGSKGNVEAASTSDQFTGTGTDYFQFSSYGDKAYFTNFVDAVFQWTGSGAPAAHTFSSLTINKARIILPYKQRLIILNTKESGTEFPQRVRWTAVLTSPTATPDWDSGSALDASTQDAIIGAKFLKDTLVVYFENSVWALKDSGSADIPFRWEKIDDLSTFINSQHSVIGHQNAVWAFGRSGWQLCDGFQVKPFDTPIPDFPEKIAPDERDILFSGRNLTEKQIWMAYPSNDETRNNSVLVYNYESPSFCEYNIDYNVSGEFSKQTSGTTYADIVDPYEKMNTSYEDYIAAAGIPEMFTGTESGMFKRMNESSSDDGVSICLDLLTSRLVPYPDAQGQLGWIDFLFTKNNNTSVNIEAFSDWDPLQRVEGSISLDSDVQGQEKVWKRFYVNLISQAFRIRIYHDQPEPFELHAMVPYFRKAGRLI